MSEFGFREGDRIRLEDEKGRMVSFTLKKGETFHTHKGWIRHDDVLGLPEGSIVVTNSGMNYQAFTPLYSDFVLGMPRGATIIYPKDAALIIGYGDIRSGQKVIEAGAGSGALSIAILKALAGIGELRSYEAREDFSEIATRNVLTFFGSHPTPWTIVNQRLEDEDQEALNNSDRFILDMLAPWEHVERAAQSLKPGGMLVVYVATTTQLSRTAEAIKADGRFSEPESFETLLRNWHHEGLAVRPVHSMNGHTGFLTFARRNAGTQLARRRRPAKGAYSEDFSN
jgi:tRNA (adenine57-N1/adenine58-N1)-methyltransferase catalytic subunit